MLKQSSFFTARVRSMREGTVFTGVCLLTSRGGVPTFRAGRGVPTQLWTGGGVPTQLWTGGVPTLARVGGVPTQLWVGGVPTLARVGGYLPR